MARPKKGITFWDRVYSKIEYKESGCHEFTGHKDECGYGRIYRNGKLVRIHREVLKQEIEEIPDGMVVMHKCDNPACINPEHLVLGYQVDNIKDMDSKGRRITLIGSQHSHAKLKESDIPIILYRLKNGETCISIANDYFVSEAAIRNVKKGRNWTHVSGTAVK